MPLYHGFRSSLSCLHLLSLSTSLEKRQYYSHHCGWQPVLLWQAHKRMRIIIPSTEGACVWTWQPQISKQKIYSRKSIGLRSMIQSMHARLAFIHCLLEGDRGQLKGSILVDASMQAAGRSPLSPVFNQPHTKNSFICHHIKRATPSISLKQVNNQQHQSSMLLLARSQLPKSRCKLKNKTVAYTES